MVRTKKTHSNTLFEAAAKERADRRKILHDIVEELTPEAVRRASEKHESDGSEKRWTIAYFLALGLCSRGYDARVCMGSASLRLPGQPRGERDPQHHDGHAFVPHAWVRINDEIIDVSTSALRPLLDRLDVQRDMIPTRVITEVSSKVNLVGALHESNSVENIYIHYQGSTYETLPGGWFRAPDLTKLLDVAKLHASRLSEKDQDKLIAWLREAA